MPGERNFTTNGNNRRRLKVKAAEKQLHPCLRVGECGAEAGSSSRRCQIKTHARKRRAESQAGSAE